MLVPEALDVIPVERRLEFHAAGALAPGLGEALGDVALAAAVDRRIDGQAKGVVAGVARAPDMVVDEGVVAAHVELEDLRAARPCRDRLERDFVDGAQEDGPPDAGPAPRHLDLALVPDRLEAADG